MSAIQSELELRNTYQALTRMYDLRDRVRADTTGDPEVREEQAIGIGMMIREIERQIAAYLTSREEQAEAPLVKTG